MTNILISCARQDRKRATNLADSLRMRGYSVALEKRGLAALNPFSKSRDNEDAPAVVLILWTPRSVSSDRVVAKADDARWRRKYIGVLLTPALELPLSFDLSQTVDMSGGQADWEQLDNLCDRLSLMIRNTPTDLAVAAPGMKPTESDAEAAIWYKIDRDNSVSGYQFYLKQYGKNGAFYRTAQTKIKELTNWRYRLSEWTNSRLAKGLAVLALVICGASLFAMSRHSANANDARYAALETRNAELEADLVAANTSRLNLIASFSDKVSVDKYTELKERTAELERQLVEVSAIYSPSQSFDYDSATAEVATAIYVPTTEISSLSPFESGSTLSAGADSAMEFTAGAFGGEQIVPSSGTPWICTVEGDDGVSFGSTCWPRSTSKLALDGFGIETATSLEPVKLLRELEDLDIAGAWLSDLEPLASMTSLKRLNIAGTAVKKLDAIAPLKELEALDLAGTEIQDLTPLQDMTMLTTLCPPTEGCIVDDAEKVQKYLDEHAR